MLYGVELRDVIHPSEARAARGKRDRGGLITPTSRRFDLVSILGDDELGGKTARSAIHMGACSREPW